MKLEHVALNVSDPVAMADWYHRHLGMTIVTSMDEEPFAHFIRDSGGRMMLEIYKKPPDNIPNYGEMHPLLLHFAFVSEDPETDRERLLKAGASLITDEKAPGGSHIVTMRDPWELCIQLCKRKTSLLCEKSIQQI